MNLTVRANGVIAVITIAIHIVQSSANGPKIIDHRNLLTNNLIIIPYRGSLGNISLAQ
jgi:hypothetical protein